MNSVRVVSGGWAVGVPFGVLMANACFLPFVVRVLRFHNNCLSYDKQNPLYTYQLENVVREPQNPVLIPV